MSLRRLCLGSVLALVVGAAAAPAPMPPWPMLTGELSGKFQLNDGSDLPDVAWRLKAVARDAATVSGEFEAEAPGLALRAAVTLPRADAPGTWRLHEAMIAVPEWWARAAARANITVKPADLRCSGTLRLAGEGTWTDAGWSGVLHARLAEGSLASDEQAWTARDLTIEADLMIGGAEVAVLRTAEVRAGKVDVAGLTIRNVVLSLVAAERGELAAKQARLDMLGGRIVLAPFTLNPRAPAVHTAADFSEIALGELAALVPHALAEARGQIGGRVSVNWSLKAGIQPDAGGLDMTPAAPATFRLAKSPGLLTGHTSPRLAFLPAWTGPFRRWFSADNPAYESLRRIEMGETPLTLEDLRVRLLPDGPDGARTASVEVAARPTAGTAVERVTFSVNLSGPLTQVLRLGMDERTHVRMTPAR